MVEDVPLLVDHFIRRFNNLKKKLITDISPDALAALASYDYPGNIRELENIIEHAFVLCRGTIIDTENLPENVCPKGISPVVRPKSIDDAEASYISEVLARHGWNRKESAGELGIHKTTLWRKMKKLGIRPPAEE